MVLNLRVQNYWFVKHWISEVLYFIFSINPCQYWFKDLFVSLKSADPVAIWHAKREVKYLKNWKTVISSIEQKKPTRLEFQLVQRFLSNRKSDLFRSRLDLIPNQSKKPLSI